MEWGSGRRTTGELRRVGRLGSLFSIVCALALAGCNPDNQSLSAAQPRGATVAFDSLDGLPPGQFQKLVGDLNEEARHAGSRSSHANSRRLTACAAISLLK